MTFVRRSWLLPFIQLPWCSIPRRRRLQCFPALAPSRNRDAAARPAHRVTSREAAATSVREAKYRISLDWDDGIDTARCAAVLSSSYVAARLFCLSIARAPFVPLRAAPSGFLPPHHSTRGFVRSCPEHERSIHMSEAHWTLNFQLVSGNAPMECGDRQYGRRFSGYVAINRNPPTSGSPDRSFPPGESPLYE